MFTRLVQDIARLYGVFVIIGGVMGYLQAGSLISLYAGIGAGSVALVGGLLVRNPHRVDLGLKVVLTVAIALAITFTKRLQDTGGKFMPAGFMILNSSGLVVMSALAMKERAESRPAVPKKAKRAN
jgi:uncharacterized membrane protein (UPF0136 family)